MKIKRFFAPDVRQAIRMVRIEHGSDAVILSNEPVEGGVEIISAIDYDASLLGSALPASGIDPADAEKDESEDEVVDAEADEATDTEAADEDIATTHAPQRIEWSQDPTLTRMQGEVAAMREMLQGQLASLAWNDTTRNRPGRAAIFREFSELRFAPQLTREIVLQTTDPESTQDALRQALHLLIDKIPVVEDKLLEKGGTVAVVGPTGVGKTTTVAKLAARYVLRHGSDSVALVSTDCYRVGAKDQLANYARIIGVPMHLAADRKQLETVLNLNQNRSLVLIDTAGMAQRDIRLSEQFQALLSGDKKIKTLVALPASGDQITLEDMTNEFLKAKPYGCVLTKVDEAASLGAALSVLIQFGLPLAYITDGQRVPEDIHLGINQRHALLQRAARLRKRHKRRIDDHFLASSFGKDELHAAL